MPEFNSISQQAHIWANCINHHTGEQLYGYEWGDPLSSEAKNVRGDILGDYKTIKDTYLLPNIIGNTVIDLGSCGGKWTQYMLEAKRVICVDISTTGFEYIKQKINSDKRSRHNIVNWPQLFRQLLKCNQCAKLGDN